jgi:hypothetical protein
MTNRPTKDLVEYLTKHLDYEVDMLNRTYDLIPLVPLKTDGDFTVHNALIESFCIHARALFEFVGKETGRHEYTHKGAAAYACKDLYEDHRQSLNQQIAHVIHAGRKSKVEDKIRARHRFNMMRALHTEWAHFKQSRTEFFASLPVKDVVLPLVPPNRDTTTVGEGEMLSTWIDPPSSGSER